jgi:cyclopropane fatty-acyl-phospholipid synthase-like methyltransferase
MTSQKNSVYWNNFYKKFSLQSESNFAKFVIKIIKKNKTLIDIGCGNGRDTFFFIKKNIKALGIDKSITAISKNKNQINFKNINILKNYKKIKQKFDYIYARFFLHAIGKSEEIVFLKIIRYLSKSNSTIYLEFRTDKDPLIKKGSKISKNERIHGHYRRFINVENFCQNLKKFKFKILLCKQSTNFSKFKNEKPHICRLILKVKK